MTRGRRGLQIGLIAIAVLILAVVVGVQLIDSDALVARALQQVEARTGYVVTVREGSEVRLGWTGVYVKMFEVRAVGPEGAREIHAESMDIHLALLPLLRKNVEVRELVMHGPARYGQGGWVLEAGEATASTSFTSGRASGGEGSAKVELDDAVWITRTARFPVPKAVAKLKYAWNADATEVTLSEVIVRSGDLELELDGAYHSDGEAWAGRLEGSAPPASIGDLAAALPDSARRMLEARDLSGTLALTRIVVETPAGGEAVTSGEVRLSDVRFRPMEDGEVVQVPEAVGTFRYPGPASVRGRALSGDSPVDFHLAMQPRDDELLDFTVQATAGADLVAAFLPPDSEIDLDSGSAAVDLNVLGAPPFTLENAPSVTGTVDWTGLTGTYGGKPLRDASGRIIARGHRVELERFAAEVGGSDLTLRGTVADLREPRLDFTLVSNRLNLDELRGREEEEPAAAAAGEEEPPSPALIPVKGNATIGTLITGGMEFGGVDAFVEFGEQGLNAELRQARVAEGTASGTVRAAYAPGRDAWAYEGQVRTQGVKLATLRPQGFGGFVMEGALGSTLDFSGDYTLGESPWPGMSVRADVGLLEGAVRNVPQLVELGQRLGQAGVTRDRWPFQNLFGFLGVERGNVLIDTLTIRQTGVEWILSGRLGKDEGSFIRGTARLDPAMVRLPSELAAVASFLQEPDGRVPVDFAMTGRLPDLSVSLDWDAVIHRAAARAAEAEKQKILDALEDAVPDADRLKKLREKLGGG